MAEKRMFTKTIIDSDAFLDMPLSTQALYFHLSMRADDDGFINNPKKLQRMIGCADDDLKLLAAKRFIIPFESGVVVIKHWKMHNYIQKDRYKETVYLKEKELLAIKDNKAYSLKSEEQILLDTDCIHDEYSLLPQVRLGKDSIEIDKDKDIAPAPEKPNKKIFGEFEKVKLTNEEYLKLIDKLGQSIADDFINRLDGYKASTGKIYKSDYATILNWSRKEPVKTESLKQQPKSTNKFHNFPQKMSGMGEAALEEIMRKKLEKLGGKS